MRRKRKKNPGGAAIIGLLALGGVAAVAYFFFVKKKTAPDLQLVTVATPQGVVTVPAAQAPDANVPISFEV